MHSNENYSYNYRATNVCPLAWACVCVDMGIEVRACAREYAVCVCVVCVMSCICDVCRVCVVCECHVCVS